MMSTTDNLTDINELVMALAAIQETVTPDCRQGATLILSGFLVVGILLIFPALMQTTAAYLWIGQCQKQLHRQQSSYVPKSNTGVVIPKELRKKDLTDMTRSLFIYRILACIASLLVLVFSTLPQLVLAVASAPKAGNIDQQWGWCHAFVYMDNTTRCFATYLIVVPFVIFFWDFFFTEVVPRRSLVMKQIFRGIVMSSIPIALLCSAAASPLIYFRYEKYHIDDKDYCYPVMRGTTWFLVFDFVSTRAIPTTIIFSVGCAFLIWLPRKDYGVFYEPFIFLCLMLPVVVLESTIYLFYFFGYIKLLLNEKFSNVLLIFYSLYHMSFSSTFVLSTLRSVISEIREERRVRTRTLLGEVPTANDRKSKRKDNVVRELQRQFSVAFRWRSECIEDELHLEEHIKNRKPDANIPKIEEAFDDEEKDGKTNDVMMHYSILRRSASIKTPRTGTTEGTGRKLYRQKEISQSPISVYATPRQNTEPNFSPRHNESRRHRNNSHGIPTSPHQSRVLVNRMSSLNKQGISADHMILPIISHRTASN